MKVLLGTNHFELLAGSELVILEMAEYLLGLGHSVDIVANHLGGPMRGLATRAGAQVLVASEEINALEYDLLLSINHVGPILSYVRSDSMVERSRIIFLHVDLNWKLSQPGLVHEPLLADEVWVHSLEAAKHFSDAGIPAEKMAVFHNAAPARFWVNRGCDRTDLNTVTIVSNHAPDEVRSAADQLRAKGVSVLHVGRGGDQRKRVGPKLLAQSDAVVTIGKTVQYCLASRVPVYVYDHFGGPGYLSEGNFEKAAWHNFSGRCTQRKLTAEALADEVVRGFADAAHFTANLPAPSLARFRLGPYLDKALEDVAKTMSNEERLALIEPHRGMMRREQALAAGAGMYFRMWRNTRKKLDSITEPLAAGKALP